MPGSLKIMWLVRLEAWHGWLVDGSTGKAQLGKQYNCIENLQSLNSTTIFTECIER